jgi:hypothetical protein
MHGRKDYPGFNLAFRCSGHNIDEINNKFCITVGNDGKVGIAAFGHFFRNFDVQLVGGLCFHAVDIGTKLIISMAAANRFIEAIESIIVKAGVISVTE